MGIMVILSDFVIDSFSQLLPYLHVALTWSVLLFNQEPQQTILAQFLRNVIRALIKILSKAPCPPTELIEELQNLHSNLKDQRRRDLQWTTLSSNSILKPTYQVEPVKESSVSIISAKHLIDTLVKSFSFMGSDLDFVTPAWTEES